MPASSVSFKFSWLKKAIRTFESLTLFEIQHKEKTGVQIKIVLQMNIFKSSHIQNQTILNRNVLDSFYAPIS